MRPALVKMPVATATLNFGVDAINELVASGALLWVFNFANNQNGRIASLRFFFPELEAWSKGSSKLFAGRDLAQIVAEILPPNRATWPAGTIDELFQLSRPARIALHGEIFCDRRQGRQPGKANSYPRGALAAFLSRRWIGNLERSARK